MARVMRSSQIKEFLEDRDRQEKIDKFNSGEDILNKDLSYGDLVEISNRLDALEKNYLTFKDKLNNMIMN
jgi:hypothetical protein